MTGRSRSILVTGSSGYVGAVVVPLLLEAGYSVTRSDTGWFNDAVTGSDFSLLDKKRLEHFDIVIHLAGVSDDKLSNAFPDEAYRSNHTATAAFASRCKAAGVKRFILASSAAVYGNTSGAATEDHKTNPETHYSRSKLAAEQALLADCCENFTAVCLRFGSAYGFSPSPREDLVLNRLTLNAIEQGEIRLATDGRCYRPFLHINDMVAAIAHAATNNKVGLTHGIYNVSHPQGNLRVEQAVILLAKATGATVLDAVDKPDPRCYQIDSTRFVDTGFEFQWPLDKGLALLNSQMRSYQPIAQPDRVGTLAKQLSTDKENSDQIPSISPSRLPENAQAFYLNDINQITQQSRYRLAGGFCTAASERLKKAYSATADHDVLMMRSGTDALVRALQVLDLGVNSKIAMPDQCFHAVATAALTIGATPVFIDVRADDFNLDAEKLARAFESESIDAVIAVDNYGTPADWAAIAAVARSHKVPFIIDACESLGASRANQSALDHADIVVLSFSFTKPIHAAGMGGALIAKRHLTEIIETRQSMLYRQIRLPEINAAYLVRAWDQLQENIDHLRRIYTHYQQAAEMNNCSAQKEYGISTRIHAPFLVPVDWSDELRDQLVTQLGSKGVMAATQFACQAELLEQGVPCPVSANIATRVVTLPSGGGLAMADAERAAEVFAMEVARINGR